MVTNYDTIDGRIRSETTGGVRTGYLHDALGSVTATVQDGAVVNTYRYKPYGSQLAKTGAGADPGFTWVGQHGYRQTGVSGADAYVRARHYGSGVGGWTTTDVLWPTELAYGYSQSNPTSFSDFTGLSTCPVLAEQDKERSDCMKLMKAAKNRMCSVINNPQPLDCVSKCIGGHWKSESNALQCLKDWCGMPSRDDLLNEFTLSAGCDLRDGDECGNTVIGQWIKNSKDCQIGVCINSCKPKTKKYVAAKGVIVGGGAKEDYIDSDCFNDRSRDITVIHEALHCCHQPWPQGKEWDSFHDKIEEIAKCIRDNCKEKM